MKKKDNKGFTLVEILAAVSILSIILIIAIPSIKGIVNKFNNNYYHTLEGTLKTAAIDYYADHKSSRPKSLGESGIVTSDKLSDYIEKDLKDKNNNPITEAYAIAIKEDTNKYNYYACIETEDYKTGNVKCDYEGKWFYYTRSGKTVLPTTIEEYNKKIKDNYNKNLLNEILPNLRGNIYTRDTDGQKEEIGSVEVNQYILYENEKTIYKGSNYKDIIDKLLSSVYSSNFLTISEQKTLTTQIDKIKDNKYTVNYIYDYNGQKYKTVYKIILSDITENPVIEVTLTSSDSNGYKKNATNTKNISWNNTGVKAIITPSNDSNTTNIVKYFCKTNNSTSESECNTEETIQDGRLTINYTNNNDVITIYGETALGTKSNSISYAIKTDTRIPKFDLIKRQKDYWSDADVKSNGTIIDFSKVGNPYTSGWTRNSVAVLIKNLRAGVSGANITCTDIRNSGKLDDFHLSTDSSSTINYRRVNNKTSKNTKVYYDAKISCTAESGAKLTSNKQAHIQVDGIEPTNVESKVKVGSNSADTVSSYSGSWTKNQITWNNFNATESGSGIDHYEFVSIVDGYKSVQILASSYTYPLSGNKYGNHSFKIRAVDKAGNPSDWSKVYNFKVDQEAPVIKITKKLYGAKECDGKSSDYYAVNARFSVSDNGSGTKSTKAFFGSKNDECDFKKYGIDKNGEHQISFGYNCNSSPNGGGFSGKASDYRLKITAVDNVGNRTTKYFDPSDAANSTGHNFSSGCSY